MTVSTFMLYSGLFSLGANFLEWWVLALAEVSPIWKLTGPITEKSHVSDISYKLTWVTPYVVHSQ